MDYGEGSGKRGKYSVAVGSALLIFSDSCCLDCGRGEMLYVCVWCVREKHLNQKASLKLEGKPRFFGKTIAFTQPRQGKQEGPVCRSRIVVVCLLYSTLRRLKPKPAVFGPAILYFTGKPGNLI